MQVNALLCDHAEASEGKLFINGGGVNLLFVQPQPPHVITIFIAMVVHVPYTATNQPHNVTVRLIDEDGAPTSPWVPDGVPPAPPIEMTTQFNVGRPAMLPPGEEQTVPLAFGLQGLPLARTGSYEFVIDIDGAPEKHLPARVLVEPQQRTGPPGPASIPGLS